MLQVLKSPAAIIRAAFFVQSLCIGGFFSRLAEIQLNMGASTAELGIGLLGVDVGAFLSLPFAARAIERIGNRNTLLYGTPFFALTVALTSLAPNYIVFFFLAMFVAVGFTFTAIAMNVEADRIEFATGRRIMNSSHGMWSLGFFISSLIGTAIVALGTWPALHLFAAVPVMAVAASYLIGPMQESPPRPHVGEGKVRRFVLPTSATLLLIAFAFGSIWLEAAARSWSVIYLRDVFHTANWVATLTLPVCLGAQVVGRLLGDRWIERFGPVRVAMVLTAVSFVGLVLVVLGISVPVSLFGFVLIGVGFATAFPQTLSAAARLGDRPAAENLASIQQMNTIVLFLAPPVMGFTASQWGMQVSFALILPLLVVAFVLALNLAERRPPPLRRSPPAPDPY